MAKTKNKDKTRKKTNKSTKHTRPTNDEIVKEFIGDLEHFIDPKIGGWPLILTKDREKLMRLVPIFKVVDGRMALDESKKVDPELVAELWKFKYEELLSNYSDLYSGMQKLLNQY